MIEDIAWSLQYKVTLNPTMLTENFMGIATFQKTNISAKVRNVLYRFGVSGFYRFTLLFP